MADFEAFYESTYTSSYRTALGVVGDPFLAADAVQNAYVSAFRARHRYRGDAPPQHWLLRIVVNASLDVARGRRKVREVALDPSIAASHPGHEADVAARLSLDVALSALPSRQRAAIVLRYFHDLDYAAIAGAMGTTPGNVGVLLSRALDSMRADLTGQAEQ